MKVTRAARQLAFSGALLLGVTTVSIASQTYVLRSGASRRDEAAPMSQRREPSAAVPLRTGSPWIINNQYEIDDPDAPAAGARPEETGSSRAVAIARMYRGVRYVWGGTTSRGFDCSGFVRYVYARLGHSLPRTASEQFHTGHAVSYSQLKPGDILFFHTSRRGVSHVGIYVGNSRFIHAANPRKGVTISSLSGYYAHRLVGARRVD